MLYRAIVFFYFCNQFVFNNYKLLYTMWVKNGNALLMCEFHTNIVSRRVDYASSRHCS